MTIHAAKGLEFPITIVSGMSTAPPAAAQRRPRCVFPPTASVGYRFGKDVTTEEYEDWKPDRRADGLRRADPPALRGVHPGPRPPRRVAAPRPRGSRAPGRSEPHQRRAAARRHGRRASTSLPDAVGGDADPRPPTRAVGRRRRRPFAEWRGRARRALARGVAAHHRRRHRAHRRGRPTASPSPRSADRAIADATAAAEPTSPAGLQKRPRDLDLPPWLKGRYGTAVGRAVHGVLQTIDLATGDGLDAAVAAQCEAEAIPDRADDVRALVGAALGSPSWCEAAAVAALAGGLRLHAGRRPPARGLHRPAVPQRPTAWSSSTTRPRPPTTRPSSTGASRATGCRARPTRWPSGQATGEPVVAGHVPVPHPGRARSSVDLADLDAAVAEVARARVGRRRDRGGVMASGRTRPPR